VTIDYISGTIWADNRIRAYRNPPSNDATVWAQFPTAALAGATSIEEVSSLFVRFEQRQYLRLDAIGLGCDGGR
jgi:hypothetical protein